MSGMVFVFEKLGFMGLNPSFLEFQLRRRVQTWQKGANLAEGCKPGRRVQTWQKGANLAEGCKPGRRVQTWQKGAKDAKSGYPPCTFAPSACFLKDVTSRGTDRPAGTARANPDRAPNY